jgi:hypothetical protein
MTGTPRGQRGLIAFECFSIGIKHATRTAFTTAVVRVRFDRTGWWRIGWVGLYRAHGFFPAAVSPRQRASRRLIVLMMDGATNRGRNSSTPDQKSCRRSLADRQPAAKINPPLPLLSHHDANQHPF